MYFESTKKYIINLKFKDQYEYYNYIVNNDINFLPKRPDSAYCKNWKGYLDFLGCKTYLDENKIYCQREKKFKTCLNIKELPLNMMVNYIIDQVLCLVVILHLIRLKLMTL
jgi:hypothetical protein